MTAPRKRTPARKPAPAAPAEPAAEAAVEPVAGRAVCNVPGCEQPPETASLCGTHFATHRGYAVIRTVKEEK